MGGHTVVLHYLCRGQHLITHKIVEVTRPLAPVDCHQSPVRQAVKGQARALHKELGRQLGDLDAVDVDRGRDDEDGPRLASRAILQGLLKFRGGVVAVELGADEPEERLLVVLDLTVFPAGESAGVPRCPCCRPLAGARSRRERPWTAALDMEFLCLLGDLTHLNFS